MKKRNKHQAAKRTAKTARRAAARREAAAKPKPRTSTLNLFQVLQQIEEHLHRHDVVRARSLLDMVVAVPNLPLPFQGFVRMYEADLAIQQSKYDDARRWLRVATDEDPNNEQLKAMSLVLLAGIEQRTGTTPDTILMLEDARAIAKRIGDNAIHGDATFNLAVLMAERDDPSTAERLLAEAKHDYTKSRRFSRVVDCDHLLATLPRVDKRETDEDLEAMHDALFVAMSAHDHAQIARIAGDLARTHYCSYLEDRNREHLANAEAILLHALVAQDLLWKNAERAAHRIGARIELAADMFNNIETALLVQIALGRPDFALSISARVKARILRSEVGRRNLTLIESFRDRDGRLADLEPDGLQAACLSLALDELAAIEGKRVALIDQVAMGGDRMLLMVDVTGGSKDSVAWSHEVEWPGEPAQPVSASLGRGQGHGVEARKTLAAVLSTMETFSGRAAVLYDESLSPDVGQRETIETMGAELGGDLKQLGSWLFPSSVIQRLVEECVEHVIVCPDPRLFNLPIPALVLGDDTHVIDASWTMSILPSAYGVYDVLRRTREASNLNAVHVLAPIREVNEALGGNTEVAHVVRHAPSAAVHWLSDATRPALQLAANLSGWIHIRSHGTLSDVGYVPALADGPWREPLGSSCSPFLVSACCRTGETLAQGQDIFGFVEMVDRDDFAGVLTPVVSLEGFAAAKFMGLLYDRLAEGSTSSAAAKHAAMELRKIVPHPAAWGVFACIGDPWKRLPPQIESLA